MNRPGIKCGGCQAGQGLVEFLVILPVILVLLASVPTLLSLSIRPLWVDELLYARLLTDVESRVFDELSRGHSDSLLPAYFSREDVQVRLSRQRNGAPGFSLHRFHPRVISTIEAEARSEAIVHPGGGKMADLPDLPAFTGKLGLLNLVGFRPAAIRDELRAVTLGGRIPSTLRAQLRMLGLEPVPLNLNVVPGQGG